MKRDWGSILFNRQTVRPALYETRALPESEWTRCLSCSGTGEYYSQGDLHRSPGVVPCGACSGGLVKTLTVMVRKPVYRVKARSLP